MNLPNQSTREAAKIPATESGSADEAPRGRRRGLRLLLLAAGLLLFAGIFGVVGWPAIASNLQRIGFAFVALTALYLVAQVAFAVGWWEVLEPRPPLSQFPRLFAVYLAGDAANYLAPGNVAGEPLKVHLLRSATGTGRALASITIHKHADLLAQWVFVSLGVVVAIRSFPMSAAARAAALAGAASLGALLFLLTWALRRGTFSPVLRRLARWKPIASRIEKLHRPAAIVDERIQQFYARHRGRFAAATAWCFLGWCGGLLETYIVLRVFSRGAGWTAAFAVEALAMALNNMLPFLPGRVGTAEGVRVGVFLMLGLPAAQGAAYGLVRRGRELAWTVPGLFVIARRGARDEARTPEAKEPAP
jgi:uncharacterized protein (TIRG00374 family)